MSKKVNIVIATHKKYHMPSDEMYLPLHVGAEGKYDAQGNPLDLGYIKDNTGDNISTLNSSFCELTGLYWAWKHLESDYIGLVHYRRHFSIKNDFRQSFDSVLTYSELKKMLPQIRLFIPQKRWYVIETLYSHYAHTHYAVQLDKAEELLKIHYPEYIYSYKRVIKHRYGYMFNMMIMDRELLDQYCTWVFDMLFKLKDEIDMPELDLYQARYFGRVSEILFNVWIDYMITSKRLSPSEIKELPCVHMEKINWFKKGSAFLKAKFFKEKYKESF